MVDLLWALLLAAPFSFAQNVPDPRTPAAHLLTFTLDESREAVARKMGPPPVVADYGPGYQTWQYRIDVEDHHDFSHLFCFRRSDGRLVSITRNGHDAIVDDLFPPAQTAVHHWPDSAKPQYSVLLRRLPGDRLLLAMGARQAGEPVAQLMLIHRSAVKAFLPWLDSQLQQSGAVRESR